jgi:hypothetical protein
MSLSSSSYCLNFDKYLEPILIPLAIHSENQKNARKGHRNIIEISTILKIELCKYKKHVMSNIQIFSCF